MVKESRKIEIDKMIVDRNNQINILSRKFEAFERLKFRFDEDQEKLHQLFEVGTIDKNGDLIERIEF